MTLNSARTARTGAVLALISWIFVPSTPNGGSVTTAQPGHGDVTNLL
jgi:hypothetical protein